MNTPTRTMLANFQQQKFFPLPDDIESINVSRLRETMAKAGAAISYPTLLKLIRGAVEMANGFELVKVEHFQPVHFKNIERPILHRDTNMTPVPIKKGTVQDDIFTMLMKGVASKDLLKRFPNATGEVQMLADVTKYVNAYGYELNYSSSDKVVQLVIPTNQEGLLYAEEEVAA